MKAPPTTSPNKQIPSSNMATFNNQQWAGGYEDPANKSAKGLPAAGNKIPSEVCDCLSTAYWFWEKDKDEDTLRSAEDVAARLVLCNSRRTNYLLNVAPDSTGRIPDYSVKRLKEVRQLLDMPESKPTKKGN